MRAPRLLLASLLLFTGLPLQAGKIIVAPVQSSIITPRLSSPRGGGRGVSPGGGSPAWIRTQSGILVPNPNASLTRRLQSQLSLTDVSLGITSEMVDAAYEESESIQPVLSIHSGLSGRQLLEELHRQVSQNHQVHSYDNARREMFSKVDNITINGVRGVIDAYSGIFVAGTGDQGEDYRERGDQNRDGNTDRRGMNAEHIWPQSFFDSRSPMRSDLHHLLPTFMYPNEVRGHLPFGEVTGRPEYTNSGGAKMGGGVFEPPHNMKGRIARAMMYFYVRYHNSGITHHPYHSDFWNGRIEMFLRWNREHPVTADEIERNDRVAAYQGNRNPFVDDPSLADRIGLLGFQHVTYRNNRNGRRR